MYIFSYTPGIKEEQEKESSVPTCKIQTATEDVPYAASSRNDPSWRSPISWDKVGIPNNLLAYKLSCHPQTTVRAAAFLKDTA